MKIALVVFGFAIATLGIVDAIVTVLYPSSTGSSVLLIVVPIVIIASATAAFVMKRSRERRELTSSSEGIERELALTAQSRVMVDGILVGLGLGLLLLFLKTAPAPMGVFLLVVFMLVDFWARFSILLRRAKQDR
jgi:F0F1-type ATP synthase assembly protein I